MVRPVTKQEKKQLHHTLHHLFTLFQLLALYPKLCSVAWLSSHEYKLAFTDNA